MKRAPLLLAIMLLSGHTVTSPDGAIVDYSELELKHGNTTINCCNERDCRPVPSRWNADLLQMEILGPDGWTPVDRSLVVDPPAPDGRYHACWFPHRADIRCIWEPSRGS